MREITKLLNDGVKLKHFPGASYAIVYKTKVIDDGFVGYKQISPKKIKNMGNEIYDCASLTKVIATTTMIMKLIEIGKLQLNTKVSNILPEFIHKNIQIKHLLTHSSGLPADIHHAKMLRNRADVLKKIYKLELINSVGKKIIYSDVGFIFLGLIIEKLTNKKLSEYADEIIFKPLEMNDTSYHPNKNRSAPTEFRNDDVYCGLLQGIVHDEKSFALNGEAGHAGMFSTVKDLSKFILSILKNDEIILKKDTVDMLFKLRISDVSSKGNKLFRSLGWNKPTKGGTAGDLVNFEDTILHTGFTGCNIWIDRFNEVGFIMLSNAIHPHRELNGINQYRNKIGNIIISLKEK